MTKKNNGILTYAIIGFYLISLFTESFTGGGGIIGILTLIFGGLSILMLKITAFGAWSANILFFVVLIKKSQIETKLILSGISVILGFLALFVTDLPMHMGSTTSPVKIGIGFYFWIASLILLFNKSLIDYLKVRKK
tara:strand:+ start:114 stop:524 length:411 start_codon:yes stop_codon:yes gene_type:complete